jgi:hypothetical protein
MAEVESTSKTHQKRRSMEATSVTGYRDADEMAGFGLNRPLGDRLSTAMRVLWPVEGKM